MKSIFRKLRSGQEPSAPASESAFFTTTLAAHGFMDPHTPPVPWEARAIEVSATRLPRGSGAQLEQLWSRDRYLGQLDAASLQRLSDYFIYAAVAPQRDVIRQEENGSFMAVVLSGQIAVERQQPWGERMRWRRPVPATSSGRCRCWTAGRAFPAAPR
jgi:hypothetical protein